MAKVVAPIVAVVEIVGKPKPSAYHEGEFYYPTLFLDQSKEGDEAKIWKSLTEEEASQLRKGARVQLVPAGSTKNGQAKHNIVLLDAPAVASRPIAPTTAPAQQTDPYRMSDDQKRDVAAYVSQMGDLLAYCRNVAQQKLGDVEEETIRTSTASLFIAAQRKFNL
ncbi:hypothetical protein [Leptolyngbya ohadii]|uniref:hypothetical protein n=1 Tax=Leptolyngbya ohadii TaxID=1962290 RepID=UPI000B59F3B4|nr:hypothetical protein [Leptolyngbya ohadii]